MFSKTIGSGIEEEKIEKKERKGRVRKREGDTHRGKYREQEKEETRWSFPTATWFH